MGGVVLSDEKYTLFPLDRTSVKSAKASPRRVKLHCGPRIKKQKRF